MLWNYPCYLKLVICLFFQRKANDYLIVDNHYSVMNLKTQQPYEFRVIAQNAMGPSEHSLPSMAATPKDPDGKHTAYMQSK